MVKKDVIKARTIAEKERKSASKTRKGNGIQARKIAEKARKKSSKTKNGNGIINNYYNILNSMCL